MSSHVPVPAVRELPMDALPEIAGGTELVGGAVTKFEDHVADPVDAFPAASVTAPDATATVSVPLDGEPDVTLKVYSAPEPELEPLVQIVDVPPTVTSDVVEENPVIDSLKVAVNAKLVVEVWEPADGDDARVTDGPTVSIVTSSDDEEVDTFPAKSVSVTVIDQVPSVNVPNVQLPAETVHVTALLPDFVAVTTPVPVRPDTVIVGVLSLVRSSLVLEPESDAVAKSGRLGALGPAVSIVMGRDEDAVDVDEPMDCVTTTDHVPSASSGKVQL